MTRTPTEPAIKPLRLTVRLTPRGGRDAVEGWIRDADGAPCLKVRVAAPPVDGAANTALERLIAGSLRIAAGAVQIVAGHQGRVKRLEITGVDDGAVAKVFGVPG
ncbi:DUF167 domain-containing protein [Methylobacterium sp. J-048]|uniref:DUF167 domain-containing protein n=1 Tax=Methylobacterium sp. J-048 TaxID=2836635 RepID=UPI001FB9C469|nr:DUF167 domain-containing protein [Methylobacterium sp. J-048]MCJ2060356.1 DUF167 domain-containing protein [Methylobacterium sp. J-048]